MLLCCAPRRTSGNEIRVTEMEVETTASTISSRRVNIVASTLRSIILTPFDPHAESFTEHAPTFLFKYMALDVQHE